MCDIFHEAVRVGDADTGMVWRVKDYGGGADLRRTFESQNYAVRLEEVDALMGGMRIPVRGQGVGNQLPHDLLFFRPLANTSGHA